MGLDIRLPIGMMFLLLGSLLAIYGYCTGSDADFYRPSLDINVNLWWGLVLGLFGAAMLFFGLRKRVAKSDK
jgi:hypothetical protein